MHREVRIGLCLSGGGFRATLFHLGVVRYLADAGLLANVRRIAAVSGGSILAAHLVLNWERYAAGDHKFDEAAEELRRFIRSDMRGRLVRRWIMRGLWLVPWLVKRLSKADLLIAEYSGLYQDARLSDLRAAGRPQVFFNSTSLTTGEACNFGRSGFMWYPEDGSHRELHIPAPGLRVGFAVAASSAFPALFPPIQIDHNVLSCDQRLFPHRLLLTDGGVRDNLGLEGFAWYRSATANNKDGDGIDDFIVSNAGAAFDWDVASTFNWALSRNVRAADLMMKRIVDSTLVTAGLPTTLVELSATLLEPDDPAILEPETQRKLSGIRTDLDAFSEIEIAALERHGWCVMRRAAIDKGYTVAARRLEPLNISEAAVRESGRRRWRLMSIHDPSSVATVAWVLSMLCLFFGVPIARTWRAERERQVAQESRLVTERANDRLNDIAKDFYRQRHRPIRPGLSISTDSTSAGSLCCLVRRKGDNGLFALTVSYLISDRRDHPIPLSSALVWQPGAFDGGTSADAIGESLVDPAAHSLGVGLIRLRQDITGINEIAGLRLKGSVPEDPALGQTVYLIGRTSGWKPARITGTNVKLNLPNLPGFTMDTIALEAIEGGKPTQGGDGGGAVLTADGRLVAMHFAGSNEVSYAIPLKPVFSALNLSLALE